MMLYSIRHTAELPHQILGPGVQRIIVLLQGYIQPSLTPPRCRTQPHTTLELDILNLGGKCLGDPESWAQKGNRRDGKANRGSR